MYMYLYSIHNQHVCYVEYTKYSGTEGTRRLGVRSSIIKLSFHRETVLREWEILKGG